MQDQDGQVIRWQGEALDGGDGPYLPLAGLVLNGSGVLPEETQAGVVGALQRWSAASGGQIRFDYWQGEDPKIFEPEIANDGLSSVFFLAANPQSIVLDSSTAAYTQVWRDPDTGAIIEIDMVLNDVSFIFTTDLYEVAYQKGHANRSLMLQDTITHEMGHALGIDHTGLLCSSMLAWRWYDQGALSCDDVAAVRALYPTADDDQGAIVGQIVGPAGPVHGANVVALSRTTGFVYASALSDADGLVNIGGLPAGTYDLMVEPFFSGPDVLIEESSLQGMDNHICSGELFARTFDLDGDGGTLLPTLVESGSEADFGVFEVACTQDSGAKVPAVELSVDIDQPSSIWGDAPLPAQGVAAAVLVRSDEWVHLWLPRVSGELVLTAQSHGLGSTMGVSMRLFTSAGVPVPGYDLEFPTREFTKKVALYDALLVASELEEGDYVLAVRGYPLVESLYAFQGARDSAPFVVLTARPGDGTDSEGLLAAAMCDTGEPLPDYSSPGGDPVRGKDYTRGCLSGPLPSALWPVGMFGWLLAVRRRR